MERVYNFSAGPSVLPEAVLKEAQQDLLNYKGSGMSVMEMSHRSALFTEIARNAETDLRQIMQIPDTYKVLFLQGGASTQFATIPMNLMTGSKSADFIITGAWSKKAMKEARRFGEVNVLGSSEESVFSYIPEVNPEEFNPKADYFHITSNNTIYATRYTEFPETGNVPLIADMSSNILSEKIDVSRFGMIYAGAQKNVAPAGLTLVIIREDLLKRSPADIPTFFNYNTHADADSMFNTPPCFCIYIAGLVFEWIKQEGGLSAIQKRNEEKAALLYKCIDESNLFTNPVKKKDRSLMNVTFVTQDAELNKKFITEATANGLVSLKGHRSVGGMRASIYNAMPVAGVQKLVDFINQFDKENG